MENKGWQLLENLLLPFADTQTSASEGKYISLTADVSQERTHFADLMILRSLDCNLDVAFLSLDKNFQSLRMRWAQ